MASISTNKKTGERTLQFVLAGKRKSIWLGKMSKRDVVAWKAHVQELVAAKMHGNRAPYDDTSRWVAGLDIALHRKLAGVGLVESREAAPEAVRATLAAFMQSYIEGHSNVKDGTVIVYDHTQRCLIEFFGAGKPLSEITTAAAQNWRQWLLKPKSEGGQGLAENTARRRCGIARKFFAHALDDRIIAENPFGKMKNIGVQANRTRDYFLSREDAAKVIDACPDAQWRLLFALSRFGGLRCPSEHLGLRWGDVDWERGRIVVSSPKTAHHDGKESRTVPIFPELKPHLEAVYGEAEEGTEFVITRYRERNANLRTQLERIIGRAGLKPWPKLFQNLRATRETELAEHYPSHVVCKWIGHDERVANKH